MLTLSLHFSQLNTFRHIWFLEGFSIQESWISKSRFVFLKNWTQDNARTPNQKLFNIMFHQFHLTYLQFCIGWPVTQNMFKFDTFTFKSYGYFMEFKSFCWLKFLHFRTKTFSVILDKQIGPAEIMLPCCQDTFYYYVKSIKCLGNVCDSS